MNHPSSQKNQPRFVGVMGGIAVLIAAMSFFGGLELCYSVASKTTDAKVTKQAAETRRARGGGLRHTVVVDYSFTEVSGHRRNERDELPFDSARTLGETVRVQYIPGVAGMSRMQGSTHRTLSLIMLGILGLMFVILLGIGLLNAKTGQRVKVSEEKPISVEHAAKSLTTSNVEWIGWSITGVMGLLLLTPFFLSGMRFLKFWTDYGIAWLVGVGAFAAIAPPQRRMRMLRRCLTGVGDWHIEERNELKSSSPMRWAAAASMAPRSSGRNTQPTRPDSRAGRIADSSTM